MRFIGSYMIALLLSIQLATEQYRRMLRLDDERRLYGGPPPATSAKLSLASMILIALLFALCNLVATRLSGGAMGGDRQNYAIAFQGLRRSSSAGLMYMIGLLRRVTSNAHLLFYAATFFSLLITLAAYRISEDAAPKALFFLLTSQYVFFSFTGIKQCYANAFAAVCIVLALRGRGLRDALLSLLMIILAIWFHPTGYFLIPLYLLIRMRKTKARIFVFFLLMIAAVFLLEPLMLRLAALASPFAPTLSFKIREYFGETANEYLQNSGFGTLFKGIPYYIITALGWLKRRRLVDRIEHYDSYLLLSGITSFIYLATIYNGWIYRLSYYLYLSAAIFFVQLMWYEDDEKNDQIINFAVLGINAFYTLRYIALIFLRYGGF